MRVSDTTPAARRFQTEGFMALSAGERLRMALEMSEEFRDLARAGVASRRPDLDAAGVESEVARIYVGRQLYDRVAAARRTGP